MRAIRSEIKLKVFQIANCPPDFVIIPLRFQRNTPFQAKDKIHFSGEGLTHSQTSPLVGGVLPPQNRVRGTPSPKPTLAPNQAFWIRPCVPRIPARFTPIYQVELVDAGR